MLANRQRFTQLIIIALAAGGGVPFISIMGLEPCFSLLPFYKQTIVAITLECGIYILLSWLLTTIIKLATRSVLSK